MTRIVLGDCVAVMASMEEASIDAIVCDPPYGLEFMGKEWDSFREDDPGTNRNRGERAGAQGSPPTMLAFQNWTRGWAAEALRVLKPGGHVLAFGGTRTYHRLACGLEDAGFEIRDSLHWIYSTGFPKSLDVSKAIDASLGAERAVIGEKNSGLDRGSGTTVDLGGTTGRNERGLIDVTAPATSEAAARDGWGTALKPAHEPIVLARKPLAGTVAGNVLEHGTGALNVGGCRVGTEGGTTQVVAKERASGREITSYGARIGSAPDGNIFDAGGRWPSNVLLGHLVDCEGTGPHHTDVLCAPGCPVAELNEASGESSSSSSSMPLPLTPGDALGGRHGDRGASTVRGHDDQGGAARFFYVAKPRRRERVGGTIRNLHPCLPPGEMVLTDEGYEPIETLTPGRLVFADDGRFHPVLEAFSSPFDGPVFEIDVDGTNMNTRATGNHPFLAWRPIRDRRRRIVGGDVGWVRADELEPGDYMMTPVSQVGGTGGIDRSPGWWFAAGLWCAEGSVHKNQHGGAYAAYSIGDTKRYLIDRLRDEFGKVGVYPSSFGACSHVVVMRKGLVEEFVALVDRGAVNKRLRLPVLAAGHAERQQFLDGYEAGDGCIVRGKRRMKTASLRLASTLPVLIESLGVRSSMYRHDETGKPGPRINGREIKQGVVFQLYPLDGDRHGRPVFVEHDGREFSVRRVASVTATDYEGPVWNITVADRHTFQTSVGMSHNTVKPIDLMRYLVRLVTPLRVTEYVCLACDSARYDKSESAGEAAQSVRDVQPGVQAERRRESLLLDSVSGDGGSCGGSQVSDVSTGDPVAQGRGEAEVLLEGVRGQGAGDARPEAMRGVQPRVHADEQQRKEVLLEDMRGEVERSGQEEAFAENDARVRDALSARASDGDEGGLCDGAPAGDGRASGKVAGAQRGRASQVEREGRQPDREPGAVGEGSARPSTETSATGDHLSSLRRGDKDIKRCAECGGALTATERPGRVLDPFLGSGTTGCAAMVEGFDFVGIEQDEDSYETALARVSDYAFAHGRDRPTGERLDG